MVTAVTSAATSSTSSTATSKESSGTMINSDFDTYLKLLTTQMQNQDPLNPIDSSDYAVQLATFSGVEQQVKTNDILESLSSQLGLMGMTQLAGWVGMEARAAAPAYFDGNPITLSPNPAVNASSTQLVVTDANGREVERRSLDPSTQPVDWMGQSASGAPYADGIYSFSLESYDTSGTLVADTPVEVYSRITEAQGSANGTVLVLRGGISILSDDVTALREPD